MDYIASDVEEVRDLLTNSHKQVSRGSEFQSKGQHASSLFSFVPNDTAPRHCNEILYLYVHGILENCFVHSNYIIYHSDLRILWNHWTESDAYNLKE